MKKTSIIRIHFAFDGNGAYNRETIPPREEALPQLIRHIPVLDQNIAIFTKVTISWHRLTEPCKTQLLAVLNSQVLKRFDPAHFSVK